MSKPEINEITPQAKSSFLNRVIVALILIAVILPAFFLGGWVFFCVIAVVLCFAIYEMIHATGKKYPWYFWVFTYLFVLSFTYWFIIKSNAFALIEAQRTGAEFHFSLEEHFSTLDVSVIGLAVAIFGYLLMGIIGHSLTFDDVSYFITFSLLLGLGFQAAFFVRYYPFYLFGSFPEYQSQALVFAGVDGKTLIGMPIFKYGLSTSLLCFVFIGTTINDTFAYVFGSLFGKRKLNEKVSPHKTWVGFFGGWAMGTVCCLLFALPLTFCGFPMLPTLRAGNWYWIVALSIVIPLLGDLGDLSFSFIKRHYGIKDYGTLLRGHGGMIDRVGSDLFACLGVSVFLIFLTNSWNFFI
ncbi:MAG: phosphatidate cytidylyltransferase [Bacilli bacterium]|jgi:phosphatidate cytidylyltransferase|nr:phosphatidate cytidylyltransferase [Bacilli bacterium]